MPVTVAGPVERSGRAGCIDGCAGMRIDHAAVFNPAHLSIRRARNSRFEAHCVAGLRDEQIARLSGMAVCGRAYFETAVFRSGEIDKDVPRADPVENCRSREIGRVDDGGWAADGTDLLEGLHWPDME